ncbi:hypothetical protein MASR1M101_16000 [Gemmatimonas sp.]
MPRESVKREQPNALFGCSRGSNSRNTNSRNTNSRNTNSRNTNSRSTNSRIPYSPSVPFPSPLLRKRQLHHRRLYPLVHAYH